MMCGRCREVCPMQIDIPKMILELRRRIFEKKLIPRKHKMLIEKTLKHGTPYASE